MMACVRVTPISTGMGGVHSVMELSSENLCSKLKLHGISESLYAGIDDLVAAAFSEYRSLSNEKTVTFHPAQIKELGHGR